MNSIRLAEISLRSWLAARRAVVWPAFWLALALPALLGAQPAGAPANDAFTNAQLISGGAGVVAGTLMHATLEPSEPPGENLRASVWYRWTPPANRAFYFTTASAEFASRTALGPAAELFTGAAAAALSPAPRSGGAWLVTTQNVYFIRVSDAGPPVDFSLAWDTELAPADFFRHAQMLKGWSGVAEGWSNRHATWEHGEPAANTGGRSIWFRWIAPLSGTATFDTVSSDFDTLLAAYRLTFPFGSIADVEFLASSNDLSPTLAQSRVAFSVDAGREYFLAVDGHNGATGDVTLRWTFLPDAAHRPDLIVRQDAMAPSIASGVFNPGDCDVQHGCVQAGWRRLLRFGTATRNVGNADLHLAGISNLVYEYHPCHRHTHLVGFADYRLLTNGGALVASGFKASFCLEDGSRWDTNAPAAPRYGCGDQGIQAGWEDFYWDWLPCQWVDITDVPPGIYTLEIEVDPDNQLPELNETNNTARVRVTIPPAPFTHLNDSFQTPRDLGAGVFGEVTGDNRGATREPGEPALGGGRSVWFQWTAPGNGPAAFETFSPRPTFDTILGVHAGDSVSNLAEVATNDDARPGTKQSRVRFDASAGRVYHIALDGVGAAEGDFQLRWWFGAPPYDDFGNPASYDSIGRYHNIHATKQPGEPNHAGQAGGRSVWFSYFVEPIPPVISPHTISTVLSDFDTVLSVYAGANLSALTEVASNDDFGTNRWSRVTFNAVPGANYWIAVDGVAGDSGELRLEFQTPDSIFSGVQFTNGTLRLDFYGDEESRYVLEASTNLLNWSPVTTNSSLSHAGEFLFLVPATTNGSQRFFRAREIPHPGD
jgi:hypothetical protein